MALLEKIGKNRYQVLKTALGVQLKGKKHPKIMHKIFFIKSVTQKYGDRTYEYGILKIKDIRTKPELMGQRVKIIVEVVKPCKKK
jgi:hypothetical protein